MAKKVFYWICGCVMAASLILGICGAYLNPQVPGGPLTGWTLCSIFVFRPLFYGALGAVAAVKLFPKVQRSSVRACILGGSLFYILTLTIISVAELTGHPVENPVLLFMRQSFRLPVYCLIPGILLGLGLFQD